jgi:hypothetical protein
VTHQSASGAPYVVIGETHVARRVCASLLQRGCDVLHLIAPGDEELRKAMVQQPGGVAVLLHDDVSCGRTTRGPAFCSRVWRASWPSCSVTVRG